MKPLALDKTWKYSFFYCEGVIIIHNLCTLSYTTSRDFLQEDLNGCWSSEVYTNDVELFKCIPSQENEILLGIYRFYRMQNGLLLWYTV